MIIIVSLICIGYFSLLNINKIHNSFDSVNKETMPIIDSLKDMKIGVLRVLSSTMEFGLINCENQNKFSNKGEIEEVEENLITNGKILF
ncbi:hypothetical protein A2331_00715 [Candidatus Falkowbacteria bacterium RIFOXYB2_FULL_34_18]|uniref:Uncharacterized protein n=1 Tax=Candidatus Falkowbacteria bacterium RIFOXYD2_FULL_34_120 TaxID=1798007 RepID=A0A1F5TMC1_9BACT|nr:MAG: hypothetical protein A2331_00715 [Candidatus Falkowbacteria bacterium RIFOXYB2_FULL_34_18]OGF29211.1 MAG: hypothetical protein A2500_06030 [Candidatus Falkowbacteria bacterium RIFOXYC12_FULL_34_55]OGF37749.1 MAG: hypothetical protein A2466_06360 [Candidatus Falkowbacteria bacterium RIFOXYC2_FULL_34_220]OGF38733.1 MAG: hypothetical protein A2515_01695 [Candidatus Falkowbacteria bacterium RIFOXYD12_FULL_34_57]OGF39967.1 MAG: hypothetical protein A2531_01950 [Candidatus Falkowbacteria bact